MFFTEHGHELGCRHGVREGGPLENSPRGMTNFVIDSRHPKSMAHCMVTGIVAAELEVPKPMAKAGKKALSSDKHVVACTC
jgi:hypothetical protein